MNRYRILAATVLGGLFLLSSCGDDDLSGPVIDLPESYSFSREGQSTVDFSGQTTRILMGEELISAMLDFDNATAETLLEMYRNETATGGDANPFARADLNAATKSIKSKVAASRDFFFTNTTEASVIKNDFETWINAQVNEVFPARNNLAAEGVAGQLADGTSTRWVNAKGLEYNQAVGKGLIGALMLDQALNNYLGTAVLDEADNRTNNDNEVVADGQVYTTMEHKWDEAFGYVYGTSVDPSNPNATIGEDDSFLNKYVGRVESDADFIGHADDIFQAFKTGRAAIVGKAYDLRDQEAALLRIRLSEVIAIRAVYYLQQGKNGLDQDVPNYGTAFHDLSEGFGFIYSLRFTRRPNSNEPFFTREEVDGFLNDIYGDLPNGFWDVTPATLDAVSDAIVAKFGFTIAQAGSTN